MSKKIIIFIFIILAVSGVLFIQIQSSAPRTSMLAPISLSPTPTLPDQSILSFSPDSFYLKPGQASEAAILINSQGRPPSLAQLEIAYDPEVLTQVDLTPGAFFPNPQILLNTNDEETGRLSYVLTTPSNETPRLQNGIVAKLKFTVSKTTAKSDTSIYFLPKTQILSGNLNIPAQISASLKIYITNPIPASPSSLLK